MRDLTTSKGRNKEVNIICEDFLTSLRTNGFEISDEAICNVNDTTVILGIKNSEGTIAFGSDIKLYKSQDFSFFEGKENEISISSCGSFTPTVIESYWKIIHSASLLKNWEVCCTIVNNSCKRYNDLIQEIMELRD